MHVVSKNKKCKTRRKTRPTLQSRKKKLRSRNIYIIGGNAEQEDSKEEIEEIKKKVAEENANLESTSIKEMACKTNEHISDGVELVGTAATGIAVNTIDAVGQLSGVDITDSKEVNEKLDDIKETLSNPEAQQKLGEIIGETAEVAGIAIEASKPFIDPLIDVTAEKLETTGSKFGEAGVKIVLNTLEEIPFYGVLVGTARSFSAAGDAIISSINAGSEVTKASADALNASAKNFDKLMNERKDVTERTNDKIDNFVKSSANEKNNTTKSSIKKGGTKKNKSKKVRFLLK